MSEAFAVMTAAIYLSSGQFTGLYTINSGTNRQVITKTIGATRRYI